MGFFKDFETELKIFFVLVALVILVGWFGAVSTFSFFTNISGEQETNRTETTVEQKTETAGVTKEKHSPAGEQEESFLAYINESIGISFTYPKEFFVYDTAKWQEDNIVAPCETTGTIENTVIISSKNLGRCVGVQAFNSWPGDLLVSFSETEWKDFPFVLQGENPGLTEVGGVSSAKYPFLESSSNSRKQAVRLYTNTAGRGYIIEFTQLDTVGTYDAVFDEILASFQWL